MTGSHPPAAVRSTAALALLVACGFVLGSCASVASWPHAPARTLSVTATAYNSVPEQTEGDPHVAAWGDRIVPGMRAIAVSRDLVALGLGRGTRVRIEGLRGEFVVLDRMPSRWTRRIDVYLGKDVRAAREFGKRKLQISWADS
jgi:3D (Asp-Asp-Asp) domain-containing protein